jgi:hypothetical protein
MRQSAVWSAIAIVSALSFVGCGKDRSPVSPSTVTQLGSGVSSPGDSTNGAGGTGGNVGSRDQMRGVISDLSGGAGGFQFRLGSRAVRGDGASKFIDGSRTRDGGALSNGMSVEVDGFDRGEPMYASTITRLAGNPPGGGDPGGDPNPGPGGPNPGPPGPAPGSSDVTVNGILGAVTGVCPALVFPVNGSIVVTNSSTAYVGGSCQALVLGASAEVQGTQNGSTVIAREIRIR